QTAGFRLGANTCTGSIPPGLSCTATVTFAPDSSTNGYFAAQLQFSDNATGSPQSIDLSGVLPGGILTGTVRDGALPNTPPLSGAAVQICETTNRANCHFDTTDRLGQYSFGGLTPGSYNVEVLPSSGNLATGSSVVTIDAGNSLTQDFTLSAPAPLNGGVSFDTTGGAITSGVPTLNWASPFSFSEPVNIPDHGDPGSIIVLDVRGGIAASADSAAGGSLTGLVAEQIVAVRYGSTGEPEQLTYASPPTLAPPTLATTASSTEARSLSRAGRHGGVVARTAFDPIATTAAGHWAVSLPFGAGVALDISDKNPGGGAAWDVYDWKISGTQGVPVPEGCPPLLKPLISLGPSVSATGSSGKITHNHVTGTWYITYDSEGNLKNHFEFPDPGEMLSKAISGLYAQTQGRASDVGALTAQTAQAPSSDALQPMAGSDGATLEIQAILVAGDHAILGASQDGSLPLTQSAVGSPITVRFDVPGLQQQFHGAASWFTSTTPIELAGVGSAARAETADLNGGDAPSASCGSAYIDPSGEVATTTGRPVAGARVVLKRTTKRSRPLVQVPNGSAIMSPSNRRNPDITNQDGYFNWEVVPGFYQVLASRPGCGPAGRHGRQSRSALLTIPPAVINLRLILNCPHLRYLPTQTRLAGVIVGTDRGNATALVARVKPPSRASKETPHGTIDFYRGGRLLSRAALNRNGTATIVVTQAGSTKPIVARYSGDGVFAPSTGELRRAR
ncbi:MAG: carboxypeptidase regulatory-like domain-containing protein, partial [Solirubrobacteraceae bacterium]